MSGGDKKRKNARSQGWESADAEFYQESYPMDQDGEVVVRDPKHLATLLPSKQRSATIRIRTNDHRTNNRTMRRQTASRSRRESTFRRRQSVGAEVQVSMLPDQLQNLSNEQVTWEKIMQIKSMPVPMAQKREMKANFLNEPNLRLQGYDHLKWKNRKMWNQFETRVKEGLAKLELWRKDLKRIEGNFGTGVVSYFLFLKWLFFLNIFIFTSLFIFITLPMLLLDNTSETCVVGNSTTGCEEFNVLDLFQGTGFMANTVLFYGHYSNKTFTYTTNSTTLYYNMPLGYLCVAIFYFLTSLICIVRSGAKGFRERLMEGEGQFYQYCNMIFGGWDFCIDNTRAAKNKKKAIYNEIKATLTTERYEEERQNRTRNEKYKVVFYRVFSNIISILVLLASGVAIYFVFDWSTQKITTDNENIENLLFEFLPSMCIVCFNIVVPFIFRYLIKFENYSPSFALRVTLIRTVLLRLASLMTLYASLLIKIKRGTLSCWETYVGQQIYKLLLTDFATHFFLTFFVNYPRAFLARQFSNNKFFNIIGTQSFELPKHVLDVVYSQTLCLFGFFYAPLLSAVAILAFFLLFYIKKFACLVNSQPSEVIYRASRSHSMFMVVLLISYILAVLPIAYSISELSPSSSCGPFQHLNNVWELIEQIFKDTPSWVQELVSYLSTAGFAVPVFIVLFFMLYYYTAVNSANRHMVKVLKNQLVLEGHDKQFLLNQLTLFINQKKERQRRSDTHTSNWNNAST